MGAVLTIAAGTSDMAGASSQQITSGLHMTFAVASLLSVITLFVIVSTKATRVRR